MNSIFAVMLRGALAFRFWTILVVLPWTGGSALAQSINYDLATTSVLQIKLPQSQAVTVTVSKPVGKVVVGNSTIADAQPITNQSIYIVGKSLGRTTINLFSAAGDPIGLISAEVSVDTADIARSIHAVVPNAHINVGTANGRVRLSGTVPDPVSMQKVLDVVAQYGSDSIVNTITLSGNQQVNLQVRVLEAQRGAARELGLAWSASLTAPGVTVKTNTTGTTPDASFGTFITNVAGGGGSLDLTINALESKNLVRTLAEPNLTTLSGQAASFLAGGQVPVRVPDANGQATLVYKDFGVKLVFTPVVLDDGRIQIHLAPEVSEINGFTAANDPIFNTRTLDSTVELRDGQSFSVAGLLQANNKKVQKQLPWIGDVPVLGALFRSSSYQKDETELVVIVTPRLVQPTAPGQVAATPLDKTQPANDPEFFLLGQLEVTPKMIKKFENGEGVVGPFGYIIDLDGK
jgi:pilus assembly protein CpaC